jgi:hypothetical protein
VTTSVWLTLMFLQGQPQEEAVPGFTPGAEGYRFGGQPTGANQLSGLAQQTGNYQNQANPSKGASGELSTLARRDAKDASEKQHKKAFEDSSRDETTDSFRKSPMPSFSEFKQDQSERISEAFTACGDPADASNRPFEDRKENTKHLERSKQWRYGFDKTSSRPDLAFDGMSYIILSSFSHPCSIRH